MDRTTGKKLNTMSQSLALGTITDDLNTKIGAWVTCFHTDHARAYIKSHAGELKNPEPALKAMTRLEDAVKELAKCYANINIKVAKPAKDKAPAKVETEAIQAVA
jgi:hypothetical protein